MNMHVLLAQHSWQPARVVGLYWTQDEAEEASFADADGHPAEFMGTGTGNGPDTWTYTISAFTLSHPDPLKQFALAILADDPPAVDAARDVIETGGAVWSRTPDGRS